MPNGTTDFFSNQSGTMNACGEARDPTTSDPDLRFYAPSDRE
jgi:hypothetical protein